MTAPVLLSVADVAARLGVKPKTIHSYLARGILPPPDERVGQSPRWRLSTVRRWERGRPGRGARTDLRNGQTVLRGTVRLVPRNPEMFRMDGSAL